MGITIKNVDSLHIEGNTIDGTPLTDAEVLLARIKETVECCKDAGDGILEIAGLLGIDISPYMTRG